MPSTTPDPDWIRSALAEYEGRLIRFATGITGDLESARDVVQDAFLRLCREDRSAIGEHLAAWLFRVCRNRALDIRKKEGPLQHLDEAVGDATESGGPDAHDLIERREETKRVLAAVLALPPAQQEVLRLRFEEELSYKEISAITGHSVSHVGVLIHTGIKQLRLRLRPAVLEVPAGGGRIDA